MKGLFTSIATAVSDRCWLGLSKLLTSPLIIAHLHLTGEALITELVATLLARLLHLHEIVYILPHNIYEN